MRAKLIAARIQRCWTLEDAAKEVEVNPGTIHKWEHSKATPQPRYIQKLCNVYGATAYELDLEDNRNLPSVSGKDAESGEQEKHQLAPVFVSFFQRDLELRLDCLIYQWLVNPTLSRAALQVSIDDELERHNEMNISNDNAFDPSRRDALLRLAGFPLQAIGLSVTNIAPTHPAADVLTHCAAGIVACQHLSKGQHEDLALADSVLSAYLPALRAIVKNNSTYRKEAARLTTQALYLKSILGVHIQGPKQALSYAETAITYSEISGDVHLQLEILRTCAWIYFCDKNYQQALEKSLQAQSLLKRTQTPVHPLHQSNTYETLAKYQALNGQSDDAFVAMQRAHETFFADARDIEAQYIDYNLSGLVLGDGMTHAFAEQHKKALDSFAQVIDLETLVPKKAMSSERVRIEIINNATFAMLKRPEKDMDQVIKLWEAGIEGANTLMSEQRFSEVQIAYEMMQAVWPGEKKIKGLRRKLKRW